MHKFLDVKKDIFWVGALDPDLRVFDIIMYSDYGTTYNSYIVKGTEKTVLFETVKEKFFDEFLERLSGVSTVSEIDYVVISHTEPDHTGSLSKLLELNPDITVVGSASAIKFLKEILNKDFNALAVKDGCPIDIGGKTLEFFSVPNLHWPDSIYTYIKESKALFTCDSFGCHFSDERIFNDLIGFDEDFIKAYKYYFDCIFGPYKAFVLQALEKIKDLEIETICNGHGPVIRDNPAKYIEMYKTWAQPIEKQNKITVCYVSSYGYTEKLALEIVKGVESYGFTAKLFNLLDVSLEEVMVEISTSKGLLIGSPTMVSDTLPPIHNLLSSLNPVVHKGLYAGAFGSYAWSGEAVKNIESRLNQLRLNVPVQGLSALLNPSESDLEKARNFSQEFTKSLK